MIATQSTPQLRAHPEALSQITCARCDQHFLADQPTKYSTRLVGWVHERCPAATEFTVGPSRLSYGEATTWTALSLPSPAVPPHLFGSVEFRILRAWIEAEEAHPGDVRAALAAVVTEIERYRHGRRLQLADTWTSLPDWLRTVTARPREERIKALLGDWVRGPKDAGGGVFRPAELVPPRLRLTEDEAAVYEWELDGWTFEQIQRELTPPRLRSRRELWVKAERVEVLLESARAKVRGMFGVG